MKFTRVGIEHFAYVDPPRFLTSYEFENQLAPLYERLKLPQGRLELQTSIVSRGMWPVGTRPSVIATSAAKKIVSASNRDAIDLLIYAGVCRDFLEPSTASYVHAQLDLKSECISYDLSNACLGFLNAMDIAAKQIELGAINKALIVTGENSGPLIAETIKKLNSDESLTRKSVKKYIANLTIGSAGVAFILAKNSDQAQLRIKSSVSRSNTLASKLCVGSGGTDGLMMETESGELLAAGVELARRAWLDFKEQCNPGEFSRFISHQVGVAHRDLLYKSLKLDPDKDFSTFPRYGNTGSAAVPLTLCKAFEAGVLDGKIGLLGIGSGLHSIMMELEC